MKTTTLVRQLKSKTSDPFYMGGSSCYGSGKNNYFNQWEDKVAAGYSGSPGPKYIGDKKLYS